MKTKIFSKGWRNITILIIISILIFLVIIYLLLFQIKSQKASQIQTATPTPTVTSTPIDKPNGTSTTVSTQTPTDTPTSTVTATSSTTITQSPTDTSTSTPTATNSATVTSTTTPTSTATPSPTSTHTPIPTFTPAITTSLTPTHTQILVVGSLPTLIGPPDNAVFSGKNSEIVLEWDWEGSLDNDQYYLVKAKFTGLEEGVCKKDWIYFKWTKEKSFVVDPWLYDVMCPSSDKREVEWTVYIGEPETFSDLSNFNSRQLSEANPAWSFQWANGDSGSDGNNDITGGGGTTVPPTEGEGPP